MITGTKTADSTKAFTEGTDDKINGVFNVGLFCESPSILSKYTEGMCFIDDEIGPVLSFQRDNIR